MVVGQHIAFVADDDAGTEAVFQVLAILSVRVALAEETFEKGIARQRMGAALGHLQGEDVDDGGHGARRRVAVGTGRQAARRRFHHGHRLGGRAQLLYPAGRAQRAIHKIQRQRDRHGLRKQ